MYNFSNTTFERIKTSKNPQQAMNIFLHGKPKQQEQEQEEQKQQVEQKQEEQRKVIEVQTFGASKVHCCRYQSIRNLCDMFNLTTPGSESQ
jgi:GTP1/Obg family GTP-binding protein